MDSRFYLLYRLQGRIIRTRVHTAQQIYQVVPECRHPPIAILRPLHKRWMHDWIAPTYMLPDLHGGPLATPLRNLLLFGGPFQRDVAYRDQHPRLCLLDILDDTTAAVLPFSAQRRSILRRPAATTVIPPHLHGARVRHSSFQRLAQQHSRRSDKLPSLLILHLAWRLAQNVNRRSLAACRRHLGRLQVLRLQRTPFAPHLSIASVVNINTTPRRCFSPSSFCRSLGPLLFRARFPKANHRQRPSQQLAH